MRTLAIPFHSPLAAARKVALLGLLASIGCASAGQPAIATEGSAPVGAQAARSGEAVNVALVIHGGAGTLRREDMTPERDREYRAKLTEALEAGHRVLLDGGSGLDAVIAAIRILEDSPLFNAGRGAVFTAEGRNELDASIMDGATLQAGAVAGVTRVKNPIELARRVMDRSPHVLLAGAGAEAFAEQEGLETVAPEYFRTQERWDALQRARSGEQSRRPGGDAERRAHAADIKLGTVGAVALDRHGNLAAGTSTGGMTNKRWGRIGDSPIIGAGTYASNESCAVSATGHGEFFIRNVVAYDICALVRYQGLPLRDAADAVVMEKLVAQNATGGVIALDRQGTVAMPFNTEGMFRGFIDADGRPVVMIYREDAGTTP